MYKCCFVSFNLIGSGTKIGLLSSFDSAFPRGESLGDFLFKHMCPVEKVRNSICGVPYLLLPPETNKGVADNKVFARAENRIRDLRSKPNTLSTKPPLHPDNLDDCHIANVILHSHLSD